MRVLFITMMMLAVLVTGCKKKADQQPSQKPLASSSKIDRTVPNTLAAPLSAEAAKSPERVLVQTVFNCADKTKFTASFKPDQMEINSGWRSPVVLQQQPVASGFWYKNAQYDVRGKGRQATLSIQGRKPVSCNAEQR